MKGGYKMKQLNWNNRIGIFGTSRVGKSYLKDYIVLKYEKLNKRKYYILIDDKMSNIVDLKEKGFFIQQITKDNINANFNLYKFIKYHEKIVFVINGFVEQKEIHDFLNRLASVVYNLKDSLFVIDEAHQFLPKGKFEPVNIKKLERGGAKDGVDFIISTHRITDVSTDIVSLLNVIISFRVNEPNSVERSAQYFDQFYNKENSNLIDPDLNQKTKNKFKELLKTNNPEHIIRNLRNREFLYADLPEGVQEITSSDLL
jgi:DNA helicase HerA-like ATPase